MLDSMKKIQSSVVVINNPVKVGGTPIRNISLGDENNVRVIDRAQIIRASRNATKHKDSA